MLSFHVIIILYLGAYVLVGKNDAILVLCILGPIIVSYTSPSELSSSFEKVAKTDDFKFLKVLTNLL